MRTSHHQRDRYFIYMGRREVKLIDGVEYFQCNKCYEWKSRDEYHKNNRAYWKIHTYCKTCLHTYEGRSPRGKRKQPIRKIDDIKDKSLIDGATNLLKSMGYNLQEDVSQQFMERIKQKYNIDLD